MLRATQRKHALLGARTFLIATRPAECHVETMALKRLAKGLRFHHVGVQLGMADRPDAALDPVSIDVDDELETELFGPAVAERDHVAELPRGIDVEQRKRWLAWA